MKTAILNLENKFEKISLEIELLEIERTKLESSNNPKDEKRYFKINDLIYNLEDKQFETQNKIERLNNGK